YQCGRRELRRPSIVAHADRQAMRHSQEGKAVVQLNLDAIAIGVGCRLVQECIGTAVSEIVKAELCDIWTVGDEVRDGAAEAICQRQPLLLTYDCWVRIAG